MREVWTQLKTVHPKTGKGLEPDLRITLAVEDQPDLIIIENKDRRKPGKAEMAENLERYVTGTSARYVALVNYDIFTGPTHNLGYKYLDRDVSILSHFRPPSIPGDFQIRFLDVLVAEIGDPTAQIKVAERTVRVKLNWEKEPNDLDLHAWIEREGVRYHISYQNLGTKEDPPFSWLERDFRNAPGSESLTILTSGQVRIWLSAHAFSEGNISHARPRVYIEGLSSGPLELTLAHIKEGKSWHLVEVDDRKVRKINKVNNAPPFQAIHEK